MGSEFWGSETDLSSCREVLETGPHAERQRVAPQAIGKNALLREGAQPPTYLSAAWATGSLSVVCVWLLGP